MFPERFNLADYYLDARVREGRGERIALQTGGRAHSYEEVQSQANRACDALRRAGVRAGERVLILLFDGAPFVEAWFGTLKAGAVFCMANPLGTDEDIRYLLNYTGCRAVIADASLQSRIDGLAPPQCSARFFVGEGGETKGWRRWNSALSEASDALANEDTHRDDVAGWLFTSGTTGKPKAAVHFHRHFAYNTEHYAKATLGLREDDVFVSVSRLFFGYGTGTNLMFPFAVGGTAVLFPDKPTVSRLYEHIDAHGVSVLTNVPSMIRQMLDSELPVKAERLRLCLSAGEALPPALMERWDQRFSAPILDGIGSAEMFHIYITNRPGDVKPGSLGRIVSGYDARIVDDEGQDVPDGERGRLWVRGESTALCYWQDQDKSHATFRGEWCVTADVFRREEGYYYYEGRADDMLKVRGQFVSPLEIENCLEQHDAVVECAVVRDDEDGLVIPHAFVVLKEGGSASEEALVEHCKAHLTRYKFPRRFTFCGPLPRNDRGKIKRRELLP
ncbi:MAG: benzoate-CoA ligase family protein [Myxococcota bacterium]